MAKRRAEVDVLVHGSHPCTFLAAALLAQTGIRAAHLSPDTQAQPDRLVLINPRFFELDKLLAPLKRKLDLAPIHGVEFLADQKDLRTQYTARSPVGYVGSFEQLGTELKKLAEKQKLLLDSTDDFEIDHLDEDGLELRINGRSMHPRLLLLGGPLAPQQRRMLGIPNGWDQGVVHRYTYLLLEDKRLLPESARPTMPMSLDLAGMLCWGWLLPGSDAIQIAVEQPLETLEHKPPDALLRHWIEVLEKHEVLRPGAADAVDSAVSIDLPLTGALAQEQVANRTLLIGPAGGFYSACAEDVYPACWSTLFAVEVAGKALKERHLQDALQEYRQKWGTTLGDYLRGPQQNLRFLLPLVYRNPVMTTRLAEAILLGKSVVR